MLSLATWSTQKRAIAQKTNKERTKQYIIEKERNILEEVNPHRETDPNKLGGIGIGIGKKKKKGKKPVQGWD